MEHDILQTIIMRILGKLTGYSLMTVHPESIPVGVSNRHVHLSAADMEALFGAGYQLRRQRDLLQPGQFAAEETLIVAGPKGCLEKVRVLGPVRKQTQVEVSRRDAFQLGLTPPLRESGRLEGSCAVTLIGPKGSAHLREGLIIAKRHIHMTPGDAVRYGVFDGESVQVQTGGDRSLVFDQTVVRVSQDYALEFHVDTDEANAAGLGRNDTVYLLRHGSNEAIRYSGAQPQSGKKPSPPLLRLITEEEVRSARKNKTVLRADPKAIVTPLARDAVKELGVEIIWGDRS